MKKFDEKLYLEDMYNDGYFPDFLVDKIKAALVDVVAYLESGIHSNDDIQVRLDEAIEKINALADEFDENDSEIETVARESIGETVGLILEHFNIPIDVETAIQNRDW